MPIEQWYSDDHDLSDEEAIVWLASPESFDYVREAMVQWASTRRRKISWGEGTTVGYAILKPDARSYLRPGRFMRRVFWVASHDRQSGGPVYQTGAPIEAVDPRTVLAGRYGQMTKRACGCSREIAHPHNANGCPYPSWTLPLGDLPAATL